MKKTYKNILTLNESGYTVKVNRNLKSFIIKIGKSDMNNYDKKATSIICENKRSLKDSLIHISNKYDLNLLNYLCSVTKFHVANLFMDFMSDGGTDEFR